ncbi:MAG: DUF5372 family protein, partial [Wolbachia sp.]
TRLESTALKYNESLEYVTITHPFHPWKGQRFQIIPTRRCNDRDILNLKTLAGGIITILRDWTDKADPNPYKVITGSLPTLSFSHLQQLVKLVADLDQTANKKEIDQRLV